MTSEAPFVGNSVLYFFATAAMELGIVLLTNRSPSFSVSGRFLECLSIPGGVVDGCAAGVPVGVSFLIPGLVLGLMKRSIGQ